MYTRYYDGYTSQMPKAEEITDIAQKKEEVEPSNDITKAVSIKKDETIETKSFSPLKAFGNFKSDDILLIALIFIVATESSDDFLMPLILGALLLS